MMAAARDPFLEYAQHDAAHLANIGREDGYVPAPLNGRAADLASAMVPLHAFEPVLRTNYLAKGWLGNGALLSCLWCEQRGEDVLRPRSRDTHRCTRFGLAWRSIGGTAGPVVYIAAEGRARYATGSLRSGSTIPTCLTWPPTGSSYFRQHSTYVWVPDGRALLDVIQLSFPVMPSLIVVDTLARTIGNGDENSAKDMGAFVRNL